MRPPFRVLLLAVAALNCALAMAQPSYKFLPASFVPTRMSADGTTVVGKYGTQPAYYKEATGVKTLPSPGSDAATGVSGDGSVIVGSSSIWRNGLRSANGQGFIDVSDDGNSFLTLEGIQHAEGFIRFASYDQSNERRFIPEEISPNGQEAFGAWSDYIELNNRYGGVLWFANGNWQTLEEDVFLGGITTDGLHHYADAHGVASGGLLDNGVFLGYSNGQGAVTCARDNSLVSHRSNIYLPYRQAAIPLSNLLSEFGIAALATGLADVTVERISADGLTLLGSGRNPDYTYKYWLAHIEPRGKGDTFEAAPNTTLTPPSPGVLANDIFSLGAKCVLVRAPSHGTLQLAVDGSFTYSPTGGFVGGDSFTYKLQKGVVASAPITVVIRVGVPASFNTPPVIGTGGKGTGSVTLNFTASKDETVILKSSRTNVATVPASVMVHAGANSASFQITAAALSASTHTTLSATYNGVSRSSDLLVAVSSPKSLTFDRTSYSGGNGVAAVGVVVLWSKAPSTGQTVNLTSSDPSVLAVPPTVKIGAGYLSNKFSATTYPVTAPVSVTVTATGNGSSASSTVTVRRPSIKSMTFPKVIRSGSDGTVTVTLDGPWTDSANPYVVKLYLNNALSGTDVIDQGTGNTFTELKVPVVRSRTAINLLARCSDGAELEVLMPVETALLTGFTGRTPIIHGGLTAIADLHYDGKPDRAETVTYASSNTTVIPTPGQTGGAMAKSIPTKPVTSAIDVTLSATFVGVTQSYVQRVIPAELASLSVSPSSAQGGSHLTGSISLFGLAATNARVGLTSSNPAVIPIAPSATVPMGTSAKTFDIPTNPVTTPTTVTLTATYRSVQKSVTITVNP